MAGPAVPWQFDCVPGRGGGGRGYGRHRWAACHGTDKQREGSGGEVGGSGREAQIHHSMKNRKTNRNRDWKRRLYKDKDIY